MNSSKLIKEEASKLGFDLCGIAPVNRFSDAPEGFHPKDIYHDCKSVIVFAKKLPRGILYAPNCVPYTRTNEVVLEEIDHLTIQLSRNLENLGMKCVPIPSDDPYIHWEAERSYGRAILSLRHAGYLAGLGVLGKNTLLINNEFGNMIQLGALLVDAELEGDIMATYEGCIPDCRLCLDSCPKQALDGKTVNQQLCRMLSTFKTEKGYNLKKCYACRKICPNKFGIEMK